VCLHCGWGLVWVWPCRVGLCCAKPPTLLKMVHRISHAAPSAHTLCAMHCPRRRRGARLCAGVVCGAVCAAGAGGVGRGADGALKAARRGAPAHERAGVHGGQAGWVAGGAPAGCACVGRCVCVCVCVYTFVSLTPSEPCLRVSLQGTHGAYSSPHSALNLSCTLTLKTHALHMRRVASG